MIRRRSHEVSSQSTFTILGPRWLSIAAALGYALLATSTSMIIAQLEGRLTQVQYALVPGRGMVEVIPFIWNVSTLVDFVVLNPIIIFFLLKAHQKRQEIYAELKAGEQIPPYHRFGLAVVAIAFGFTAMKIYVSGFNQFYDATIVPNLDSSTQITATGWVVFGWTAIFVSYLFYGCAEQAFYTNYVIKLRKDDLQYKPLHHDQAGGVRFIMEPSLTFAYAMIALLLILLVFIIHDKILYHISDSNRLWGFAFYPAIIIPLFVLPFWHLHTLMKERRDEYLYEISGALDEILMTARLMKANIGTARLQENITSMEYIDKYRKTVGGFPTWPLPLSILAPPLGTIIASVFPLVQKLLVVLLSRFAVGLQ